MNKIVYKFIFFFFSRNNRIVVIYSDIRIVAANKRFRKVRLGNGFLESESDINGARREIDFFFFSTNSVISCIIWFLFTTGNAYIHV